MIAFWFLFKYLDPVSLETATKSSSSQFFAGITQPFHGWRADPAQNHIAVVEVTDETLRAAHQAWPLSYELHNDILEEIVAAGASAVMVDVRFAFEREGQSLHSFDGVIAMAKARGIPIMFSRGQADSDWADLPPPLDSLQVITGWRSDNGYYPLLVHKDGLDENPLLPTAAFELYSRLCAAGTAACPAETRGTAIDNARFEKPMSVRWGSRVDPAQALVSDGDDCKRFGESSLWRIGQSLRTGLYTLFGATRGWLQNRCFYALTIGAEQLAAELPGGAPKASLLAGRVVFYGADLLGEHDLVTVPALGQMPGVAMHAMAFDNLLTFGAGYFHEPPGVVVLGAEIPTSELLELAAWSAIVLGMTWQSLRGPTAREKTTARKSRILQVAAAAIGVLAFGVDLFERGGLFEAGWLALLYAVATAMVLLTIRQSWGHSKSFLARSAHGLCVIIVLFVLNELYFRWPGSDWFGLVLLWLTLREATANEKDGFVQSAASFLERRITKANGRKGRSRHSEDIDKREKIV